MSFKIQVSDVKMLITFPSPYPGGVQEDLQNEQEDLGTRLEGKFDGVSTVA
jgi:hypothetical protein